MYRLVVEYLTSVYETLGLVHNTAKQADSDYDMMENNFKTYISVVLSRFVTSCYWTIHILPKHVRYSKREPCVILFCVGKIEY